MKKIYIISLMLVSNIYSQNVFDNYGYDVLRPFFGYNNSQIISNSLGNATAGAGFIAPGLSSNPANYATNKLSTLHLNYSNNTFDGTSSISNSNFNGFDVVAPFKVYKGSFALSGGMYTHLNSLSIANNNLETTTEEGELSTTHLGAAIEFAKNIYFGIDLKFISGDNNYKRFSNVVQGNVIFSPKYDGFTCTVGMLHRYSNKFQYGISIDMPTTIDVNESWISESGGITESGTGNYEVEKPITFHAGTALFLKNKPFGDLNVLYELEFTDWSSLKMSSFENSNLQTQLDVAELNQAIRQTAQKTTSHHLGLMYQIPKFPLQILAGYEYLPTPYKDGKYLDNIRQNYSLGLSFMMHKNVSLQAGYNKYTWTLEGINESYENISIGISLYSLFSLAD